MLVRGVALEVFVYEECSERPFGLLTPSPPACFPFTSLSALPQTRLSRLYLVSVRRIVAQRKQKDGRENARGDQETDRKRTENGRRGACIGSAIRTYSNLAGQELVSVTVT